MTGIDMELIRAIAQEEGFEVTIQSLGFNAALQALSSNQVDVGDRRHVNHRRTQGDLRFFQSLLPVRYPDGHR